MITNEVLFNLFKPITNYTIVIGGSHLPLDFKNGSVLISLINTEVLSNSNKVFSNPIQQGDDTLITQFSIIKYNYQIDIYKINNDDTGIIESSVEALKIQEYLKSFDATESIKIPDCEILPCYSNINNIVEFNEQKHLINRAFFDFSLVYKQILQQKINKIDKIQTNNILIGG